MGAGRRGFALAFLLVLVLTLTIRLAKSMPEVAEYAMQDVHITAEERLGICRRGSELYFEDRWILGQPVCGCCLRPSEVYYTQCPEDESELDLSEDSDMTYAMEETEDMDGKGEPCVSQPVSKNKCCSYKLPQFLAQWFLDRKSQQSTWKRLFDLPTETKDKEKAKEKGGKFAGGVSASISRKRFAVPKKVDDALVVDDDGDLKRAILAISAM